MRICFFGEVYEALNGNVIGGSELQMALLAQALSQAGHEVIVIDTTLDHPVEMVDKIRVYNCVNGGIKKVRFFTQKLPNYLKFCYKINADVYYVRGRSYSQIIPLIMGKFFRKKIFIKAISSDIDVLSLRDRLRKTFKFRKSLPDWLFRGIITESLFTIIINQASLLLLQHKQQDVRNLNKKVRKYIFQNLFQPISVTDKKELEPRNSFLYVGTLSPKKGIVELKNIIEKLPEIDFQIIGSPESKDDTHFLDLISLQNVVYHGKKDRKFILSTMDHSIGLINPSPAEGFPNSFIESWYSGCPVVALHVDPGGVISSQNLGFTCHGDVTLMTENIKRIKDGSAAFHPKALHDYVITNHSFESAAKKFNLIIENFLKARENAN